MVVLSNWRNGKIDSCKDEDDVGWRYCFVWSFSFVRFVFVGDDVFDDVDEDVDDWLLVAVGKLGGRRVTREIFIRRNVVVVVVFDCWIVVVVGRIRFWVERDLIIFLERASKETTDGTRRVWEFIASDVVDEDEARMGTSGGVDDVIVVVPSRSLLIELDVCAAYDGKCEWDEDEEVVSPVALLRERVDERKRSSDWARLPKLK